jgi:hypothetical protein
MFNNDAELIPRTYSIKSYRKRNSLTFKKFFKYMIYILFLVVIAGIAVLSLNHMI